MYWRYYYSHCFYLKAFLSLRCLNHTELIGTIQIFSVHFNIVDFKGSPKTATGPGIKDEERQD